MNNPDPKEQADSPEPVDPFSDVAELLVAQSDIAAVQRDASAPTLLRSEDERDAADDSASSPNASDANIDVATPRVLQSGASHPADELPLADAAPAALLSSPHATDLAPPPLAVESASSAKPAEPATPVHPAPADRTPFSASSKNSTSRFLVGGLGLIFILLFVVAVVVIQAARDAAELAVAQRAIAVEQSRSAQAEAAAVAAQADVARRDAERARSQAKQERVLQDEMRDRLISERRHFQREAARSHLARGGEWLAAKDVDRALWSYWKAFDVAPESSDLRRAALRQLTVAARNRRLPLLHRDRIRMVAISQDGKYCVTSSDEPSVQIWDMASGLPISSPLPHEGALRCLAFSPNSRLLATTDDRIVHLWRVPDGAPVGEPLPHIESVFAMAFSSDSSQLVTGGYAAIRWNITTGKSINPPLAQRRSITTIGFSPDGQRIATAGDDGAVELWSAADGSMLCGPLRHPGAVLQLCFSADNAWLATICRDVAVRLWDVQNGKQHGDPIALATATDLAFSPDSRTLLVGFDRFSEADKPAVAARLYDVASQAPRTESLDIRESVIKVGFHSDGTRAMTATSQGIQIWSLESGAKIGEYAPTQSPYTTIAFSPRGDTALTGDAGGLSTIVSLAPDRWESLQLEHPIADRAPPGPPVRQPDFIEFVAFSPDGQEFLTCGRDHTARRWSLETLTCLDPPLIHHDEVHKAH